MFLSPGVTPWETTLPGVVDGANNPGIRVFEYNTQTLLVRVSNFSASRYRQITAFLLTFGAYSVLLCLLNHTREQDVVTYYLNLTHANAVTERWEKEYRLTESFRVPDASPASMHRVLERIATERCYLQKYYDFNSVSYDLTHCDDDCRVDHVCAAREVDFEKYEQCVIKEGVVSINGGQLLVVLSVAVSIVAAGW